MTLAPDDRILMKHGAGGRAMRRLIEDAFLHAFTTEPAQPAGLVGLAAMDDGAAVRIGDRWLVLTTDSHVIQPPFFPGGDIGRLSVSGTVNDLAMMGATDVLGLTCSVIIEEGFARRDLERILASMRQACLEASTSVLTGDTKVMGRGEMDGIVINTAGVALTSRVVTDCGLRPGDRIIVTGTIGDHGMAVMATRHGLGLDTPLVSDVAPINGLVRAVLEAEPDAVTAMKDPTRGGVASTLHEMATKGRVGIVIDEAAVPVRPEVRAVSELVGIEPLLVANEGKAVMAVRPDAAERVLDASAAPSARRQRGHRGRVHRRAARHGDSRYRPRAPARRRARRRTAAAHMLTLNRPLNVAVLCSHRAPGLLHLLNRDRGRGRLFEVVCCVTSERTFAEEVRVERRGVPTLSHSIEQFYALRGASVYRDPIVRAEYDAKTVAMLAPYAPDLVLLDGYLYLVTATLLSAFRARVLNLHFADLTVRTGDGGPAFPGIRAVRDALAAGCAETRATVHLVNAEPDGGSPMLRSWPFPAAPLLADALAWGATDVLKAYAFAHQGWMMRGASGPMLSAALRLVSQRKVDLELLAASAPASVVPWEIDEGGALVAPPAVAAIEPRELVARA